MTRRRDEKRIMMMRTVKEITRRVGYVDEEIRVIIT